VVDREVPEASFSAALVMRAGSAPGRTGLDERPVLTAAAESIDAHGLRDLTMRRLGAYLGVEGMALYRYLDQGLDGR
jgi:hypothetical protein